MEINAKKENLPVCNSVCRTKNKFNAECDVIVPDSKPDILKVLQVSARPKLTSCETKNGRVTITGTVGFNIIYLADDEEKCVKSITSSCEFSNVVRDDSISENMVTFVDVDISDLNCSVANCRKITLHCSLCMSLQVYSDYELQLITEIDNACTKKESLKSGTICTYAVDDCTLTDSFSLSPGKAPICEILKSDGVISEHEIKVIDDKAIVKGNLLVTVLYSSETGLEYVRTEVPFAHILQAEGLREDMDTEYCVKLLDIEANAEENSEGELLSIGFSADLFFRVVARSTCSANCVTDAFLPHDNLECDYAPVCTEYIDSTILRNIELKEKITLPESLPDISSVYQVVLRPYIENCSINGDEMRTSGYAEVYVLYISTDKDSPIYSHKSTLDFSATYESPGCMVTPVSESILKNMSYTINSDRCIEVRASININIQCVKTTEIQAVYSVHTGEYIPKKRPGIIVSCVCSGRSLWDIAREYGVYPESILKANALESEEGITPHMALIIPK